MPYVKGTKSHTNRILAALAHVYESDIASNSEIIQAARLASEVLVRRPTVKKKTEKDRLIIEALGGGKRRQKNPPPPEDDEG